MILHYYLLSPTANNTILVTTPIPVPEQPRAARRLLEAEPTAEQVGFLSPGSGGCDLALRMAGGEFCGNAAMSAAALLCASRHLQAGERSVVRLRVSGAEAAIPVEIKSSEDGRWNGRVGMPAPLCVERVVLPLESGSAALPVVRLPGITHVILDRAVPPESAERLARRWCSLLRAEALGLMFLHEDTLTPLVFVPASDTLFWEHSCASGTTAVGAYLLERSGAHVSLTLREPGGALHIDAGSDGFFLSGSVQILSEGSLAYR